jgi:thiol:disulfide interchange protein DsbD
LFGFFVALVLALVHPIALANTQSSGLLGKLTAASEPVEASLHRDQAPASPGATVWLGLRLRHLPGWHTYWINPGDSGLPTSFAWEMPRAWPDPVPSWPMPERIAVGPLMNFGYEGDLWVPLRLQIPASAVAGTHTLKARMNWLMCSDVCIPGGADLALSLELAAAQGTPSLVEPVLGALKQALRAVPQQVLEAKAETQDERVILKLAQAPGDLRAKVPAVAYFPEKAGWMVNAAPQELRADPQGVWSLLLAREAGFNEAVDPSGYLRVGEVGFRIRPPGAPVDPRGSGDAPGAAGDLPPSGAQQQLALMPIVPPSGAGDPTLGLLVLMALAGGLILNLMPCVFPVISLKLLSLVPGHAGPKSLDKGVTVRAEDGAVRKSALLYGAGVVWTFWLLGLLVVLLQSAGQAVGWGFQLQQPGFVFAMFLLFLLIGANLTGLFEVGGGAMRWASAPQFGAFGSGVLAVIVATPCTAPFMGAALGVSLGQGPIEAMAVFTALALGMTSPYLILVLRPGLIRRLPRPGAWMDLLRKALAFPMFLAAVWLAWVFVLQTTAQSVLWLGFSAVLLFAACWVYGSHVQPGLMRSEPRGVSAGLSIMLLAAAALAPLAALTPEKPSEPPRVGEAPGSVLGATSATSPATSPGPVASAAWTPWSRLAVEAALSEDRIVFVDFTAAWCVSCQANKQLVLGTERVSELFGMAGVRSFRADWTRQDPEITRELQRYGRRGVPMYLVLRQGREPLVLPEVLTYGLVRDAVASLER